MFDSLVESDLFLYKSFIDEPSVVGVVLQILNTNYDRNVSAKGQLRIFIICQRIGWKSLVCNKIQHVRIKMEDSNRKLYCELAIAAPPSLTKLMNSFHFSAEIWYKNVLYACAHTDTLIIY